MRNWAKMIMFFVILMFSTSLRADACAPMVSITSQVAELTSFLRSGRVTADVLTKALVQENMNGLALQTLTAINGSHKYLPINDVNVIVALSVPRHLRRALLTELRSGFVPPKSHAALLPRIPSAESLTEAMTSIHTGSIYTLTQIVHARVLLLILATNGAYPLTRDEQGVLQRNLFTIYKIFLTRQDVQALLLPTPETKNEELDPNSPMDQSVLRNDLREIVAAMNSLSVGTVLGGRRAN